MILEKSLYLLVWKYAQSGLIVDCKRNPQPLILDQEHYAFIDKAMMENDELTAYQLLHKLKHMANCMSCEERSWLGVICTVVLPAHQGSKQREEVEVVSRS